MKGRKRKTSNSSYETRKYEQCTLTNRIRNETSIHSSDLRRPSAYPKHVILHKFWKWNVQTMYIREFHFRFNYGKRKKRHE